MTARQAWLLGFALVALVAMLVLDLTGLAWPRLNRAELLAQMGWVGLLGLGQQAMRRHGAVDLAAGGAISLSACLIIVLAPTMGLGAALAGALLVVVSATVSQSALAARIPQPAWLGIGALALLIAASPDATGRLAPEALRSLAQEPAFAGVPWVLLVYGALLSLGALRHGATGAWLAAIVWWVLGLSAAGESRVGVDHALLWTAQGLAVAGLAGANLAAGALAAVSLSCAVHAASLFGSGRAEALVTAAALVVAACVASPTEAEPAG